MSKWCWFTNFEDPSEVIVNKKLITSTDVGLFDGLADPFINVLEVTELIDVKTGEQYYLGDSISIKLFDSEIECIDYAIKNPHTRCLKEDEVLEKRLLILKKIFLDD